MANTRSSSKRARQSLKRQTINQATRSKVKTAFRNILDPLKSSKVDDLSFLKSAYIGAVKAISKAVSKGAIPKNRAARKVSRLTLLAKKKSPQIFSAAIKT